MVADWAHDDVSVCRIFWEIQSWAPAGSVKQGHLTPPGPANFLILTIQTGEIWDFDPPIQQNSSILTHPGRTKLLLTHPGTRSAGAPGYNSKAKKKWTTVFQRLMLCMLLVKYCAYSQRLVACARYLNYSYCFPSLKTASILVLQCFSMCLYSCACQLTFDKNTDMTELISGRKTGIIFSI